jgi:beta-lactamase regulating signal transducer with metallopeptidase domain
MTGWLVETFLTVTFLMLLVLALRAPVARTFGAGWAYALWLVPAARIVLPPLPLLTPDIVLPVAAIIPAAMGSAAPSPAEAGPGQWVPFMLAMWAGGAVIFLTLQWLAYRDFLHRLDATARPARPPSYGGIMTLVSQAVDGPLAMGLIQRRIVLPSDFLRRYSDGERRLALEHELTHHRRGDIWWSMAATIVLALNWFNPVAWIAFRAFRADQELSCDAAVAARASVDERCDYARALVKSASRPGLIGACALNSTSELKRRLRMIRGHRVSAARRAGGILALSLFTTAGFAVGKPDYVVASPQPVALAKAAAVAAVPSPATPPGPRAASRPSASPQPAPSPVLTAARSAAPAPARTVRPISAPAHISPVAASAEPAPVALAAALAPVAQPAPVPAVEPVAAPRPHVYRFESRRIEKVEMPDRSVRARVIVMKVSSADRADLEAAAAQALASGGGAMRHDALSQIAEAKIVLRGLRFRAPDMWNQLAKEDCIK